MIQNTTLHLVCAADELEPGESRLVELDQPIAVFNIDGAFFAVSDTCTHSTASLSDGYLEGDEIECPLHGAKFCVRTGAALCQPATEPLQTFPVLISNGNVFIEA